MNLISEGEVFGENSTVLKISSLRQGQGKLFRRKSNSAKENEYILKFGV